MEFVSSLKVGTVNMMVRNPEEEKRQKEQERKPLKDSQAPWYDDFIRHRQGGGTKTIISALNFMTFLSSDITRGGILTHWLTHT